MACAGPHGVAADRPQSGFPHVAFPGRSWALLTRGLFERPGCGMDCGSNANQQLEPATSRATWRRFGAGGEDWHRSHSVNSSDRSMREARTESSRNRI